MEDLKEILREAIAAIDAALEDFKKIKPYDRRGIRCPFPSERSLDKARVKLVAKLNSIL